MSAPLVTVKERRALYKMNLISLRFSFRSSFRYSTMKTLCVIFAVYVALVKSAHLPPEINICKQSDPNFNECVARSTESALRIFKDGYKPLKLSPLDPLAISEMSAEGSGSVQIEQNYKNILLHGLTDVKVDEFTVDLDNCKMHIVTLNPYINILADYKLKGHMSVFNVNGHGKSNQTLRNFKLKHDLTCEIFDKDGQQYIRITDYKTEFTEYNIRLSYENLVPGNPQLSEHINELLAENSNAIFDETKAAYEVSYGLLFKQLANAIFTKVPYGEIFPK